MGDATDPFIAAHADMRSALGGNVCTAVVTRDGVESPELEVIVHNGVVQTGDYGKVIGRNSHVDFFIAEWQPQRGDLVAINGAAGRKVDAIDTDDGIVARVVLHG